MTRRFGIYLHVPLCRRRCRYCDFCSRTVDDQALIDRVAEALSIQVSRAEPLFGNTLYIGGGTPNLLSAAALMDLIARTRERFDLPTGAEVSCEANPAANRDPGYLAALVRSGLTRLSVGFQSFDDAELRLLGRLHDAGATDIFGNARRAGVESLSVDLLYGLPGQRPATFRRSLERALALDVDHLSLYALKLEPGTDLAAAVERGELPAPDPDAAADCYETALEVLDDAGYRQYEISNFARPGRRCRHNEHYWRAGPFIGLGPSAVGDDGERRRRVTDDVAAWLKAVETGAEPAVELETLSVRERRIEFAMLALRTREGLSRATFRRRFGLEVEAAFPGLTPHLEAGALEEVGDSLRLARASQLVADRILADLFN